MAQPIPLIGAPQQPEQEQKQQMLIQMNVDVQPGQTVFKAQVSPFEIRCMPVPDNIMAMAVQSWLLQHPDLAVQLMTQITANLRNSEDMFRAIKETKL